MRRKKTHKYRSPTTVQLLVTEKVIIFCCLVRRDEHRAVLLTSALLTDEQKLHFVVCSLRDVWLNIWLFLFEILSPAVRIKIGSFFVGLGTWTLMQRPQKTFLEANHVI
jgi:hypothetical protein